MYYSQEIIDQVIEANNIVEVIGSYVNLTKKGSTYFGLCPFHNEKTGSFSVTDNGSRQMFYCFGCHTGGSVLTFIMKYENLSYTEALNVLADRAGIKLPKPDYSKAASEKAKKREEILEINKLAATYFYHLLKSDRGTSAYNYLKERGLTDETIKSFGLGYSDKYRDDLYRFIKSKGYSDDILKETALFSIKESDTHDIFWNRVMFPIMDTRNRVIGFGGRVMGDGQPKYLNSAETVCFEKSRNLYALNAAKKHKGGTIILCEGYMDVISLHQAGFTNAVASLGTALTDGHVGVLKRYADQVIISYDSDTAGQDAALRAIGRMKGSGLLCKVCDLTPYKDPDELIKACGAGEYSKRLANAVNGFIFETRVLSRSFDLNDPDGRTRFGNELSSRLSYISDELERENYISVICREYDYDHDIISSKAKKLALGREGIPERIVPPRFEKKKKKNPDAGLEMNQKMLLAYLAAEPSFYDRISQYVDEKDFFAKPYDQIAHTLFIQLENGRVSPAALISSLEDADEQEKAAEVLYFDFKDYSEDEKKKALSECVIRLKQNSIAKMMQNENDAARLIELKKQQQELMNLQIF